MKFMNSTIVKQKALDVVTAADRYVVAGTDVTAAALLAAHDTLRQILTEQIAHVMRTPTPQRAAIVQRACEYYVKRARKYGERSAAALATKK